VGDRAWLLSRTKSAELLIGVLFTAFGVVACGGDKVPTPTPPAGLEPVVSVVLSNYEFEPKRFTFTRGQTAGFVLTSADEVHTFTVAELNINWGVPKSAEATRERFTFDRTGEFRLVCSIPSHEGLGMVGTIVVK
jgi:plastocyanin